MEFPSTFYVTTCVTEPESRPGALDGMDFTDGVGKVATKAKKILKNPPNPR